jgi:hypothetical protein
MDSDSISSLIRLVERILSGETDEIVFSTGHSKKLLVDSSWKSRLKDWVGKTKDLSQAYKQLAVNGQSRWASCIIVWDPLKKASASFLQVTLPFGASASVLHFNRWAKFLWFLGIKEMGLLWTCFFDDYPIITPGALAKSSDAAANLIFQILGWRVASGEKELDWAHTFNALGVTFDIAGIFTSSSTVGNKPGRTDTVRPILEKFTLEKFGSTKDLESARGKLQFMEAQVFGRTLKAALEVLRRNRGSGKKFTDLDIPKIQWILDWLSKSSPRRISPADKGKPLLLFTDGACEGYLGTGPITTTMGAVLLDRTNMTAEMFGTVINPNLQEEWKLEGKRQLVTEAELLPVLVARMLWARRMEGSKVLVFIDSNPAKFSLIRGTSDTLACQNIIRCLSTIDAASAIWAWYGRVPTLSNLADGPSRLQFPETLGEFKVIVREAPQPKSLLEGVWFA